MAFQGATMPPPSLGLDVVSPIDSMNPASALELNNVFPGASAPTVRLGYLQFATLGVSTPIRLMRELPLQDGTTLLVVATDTNLYSVTSTGTVSTITRAVGGVYSAGNWTAELFGNRMYLCNGVDAPQVYSGGANAVNIDGVPAGGVLTSTFASVASYRSRLYFVQKNTATPDLANKSDLDCPPP